MPMRCSISRCSCRRSSATQKPRGGGAAISHSTAIRPGPRAPAARSNTAKSSSPPPDPVPPRKTTEKPQASLQDYRAKRDFTRTSEPEPKAGAGEGHAFVVQKHAARRLHYDLRLELDGVLKSWAVTRGPSLTPGEKRLAVRT